MSAISLSQRTNPHIESLRPVLLDTVNPVEWLVIAHNDPQLLRSFDAAFSGCSAAVLQLSQDSWEFGKSHLSEAISWALREHRVRKLLLVGHLRVCGTPSRATLVTPGVDGRGDAPVGYSRLVAGARFTSLRNRDGQSRFSQLFNQLTEIPIVQDTLLRGDLVVRGLVYRAEDGMFLEYDKENEEYHSILC